MRADSASRWAGRGGLALGAAVLAVNFTWIATHWSEVRPIARGDIAPPFVLPRLDENGQVALEKLRGKVVLVDFWATWCDPCIASMPALERVYNRFHTEGFELVSVNTEGFDEAPKIKAVATRLGISFPVVVDDGDVAGKYHVTTFPHLVLIDRQGVVREVHRGVSRNLESHLAAQIERLLGAE